MFESVIKEFSGLTNNQAYVHVFAKRMMKPIPNRRGEFFGTDQRLYMLPSLRRMVSTLPQKHAHVFDVGAGAGDVVEYALKDSPPGTVINIEEPNQVLINRYLEKLKQHPHLKRGIAYEGFLQDYYQGNGQSNPPSHPQNLVLAIHMIYHLTDFMDSVIDPEGDLKDAISFLYSLLAPGGSVYIVYADLQAGAKQEAVCSMAAAYFRYKFPQARYAKNLESIYSARNQLLGPEGAIATHLENQFPGSMPKLHSERKQSHFFGDSTADIAVLGLATELCPSDNKPFDIAKLQFCLDYVSRFPERIGLQREEKDIPQKGMWRANEPQVIAIVTKGA